MGKGFVLCAVICSALALTVYAGLYGEFGISAAAAIVFLIGLCLIFHGMAMYMFRPRTKPQARSETGERNVAEKQEPLFTSSAMGNHGSQTKS